MWGRRKKQKTKRLLQWQQHKKSTDLHSFCHVTIINPLIYSRVSQGQVSTQVGLGLSSPNQGRYPHIVSIRILLLLLPVVK